MQRMQKLLYKGLRQVCTTIYFVAMFFFVYSFLRFFVHCEHINGKKNCLLEHRDDLRPITLKALSEPALH